MKRTLNAIWAAGVAVMLAVAPSSTAGAASPPDTVQLEITKWSIKPSVTVAQDLTRMAATVGISTSTTKDKIHTKRWGSYYSRQLWENEGKSTALDVKIGTAKLASPSPADIGLEFTTWYDWTFSPYDDTPNTSFAFAEKENRVTLFFFKGSDKADIYAKYEVTALKPGKKVTSKGKEVTLASPRKFVRNKTYRASADPVLSVSQVAPGQALTKPNSLGEPSSSTVYYNDGLYPVKLDLSFPAVNQQVKVHVKNVPQQPSTKRDSKNPIYKAAAKLVGKRSESCGSTMQKALERSKVNKNGSRFLRISLDDARTGDMVTEPGHVSILTGPGAMAIQGDVFSHKTFRQEVPLRDGYYAERPYSNVFRYHSD
ncbi:MAG: hypothetical protein LBH48_06060 [Bifidobacteriaceae bacterium]|jgi:hypothetical protein|nr:hypothetical protein [Bifidobacteriaceae bacterium]